MVALDETRRSVAAGAVIGDEPSTTRVEPASHAPREHLLAAAGIAFFVAVLTVCVRPGYMNADTLIQYAQAKGLTAVTDWYAPVQVLLWGVLGDMGLGPTFVLYAQMLAVVGGMSLILGAVFRPATAAAAAVGIALTPPVVAQLPLLGRDTWMLASTLVGFGAVMRVAERTGARNRSWAALVGACVLFTLGARQNSVPIVVALLIVLAYRLEVLPRTNRLKRGVALAVAAVVVTGAGFAGLQLLYRVTGVDTSADPDAHLLAYDVAAISVRERTVLFTPLVFPKQDLAVLDARFGPENLVPLLSEPGAAEPPLRVTPGPPGAVAELRRSWLNAVRKYPITYLRERSYLFGKQIGLTGEPLYPMHIGIDGNPWGFHFANPEANDAIRSYVRLFGGDSTLARGGHLFRPIYYLIILSVTTCALAFARRFRQVSGARAVALMGAGALLYEGTFFFLAMGSVYRFSYPMVAISLCSFACAAVAWAKPGSEPRRLTRR